ncbi:MAG: hypothetical protein D6722_22480 [Bacteroidetes bacterium]|nr:MAG: hypothetical protein D6722_22480 [Bacteroidota bacterium]
MRKPIYSSTYRVARPRQVVVPPARALPRPLKRAFWLLLLLAVSNAVTHTLFNPRLSDMSAASAAEVATPDDQLYLLSEAAAHIPNLPAFEAKVREIAMMLDIPPEWLMAVMYAESRFDPAVANRQGSGAIGLIQFMPGTALELDVSPERLRQMTALQQLEYVYRYLFQVQQRYGPYASLTDLYLGILYPKARGQDLCYTLYARPSQSYRQNAGLDEDRDGRVTVSDIDRHVRRLFPTAYAVRLAG